MKQNDRGCSQNKGKLALLMFCLCLTLFMLAGFRSGDKQLTAIVSSATDSESSVFAGLPESLSLLSSVGQEVIVPGTTLRVVLKWQGQYSGDSDESEENATMLAEQLGLGKVARSDKDGYMTYRAAASQGDFSKLSMLWTNLEQGGSYVFVTFETQNPLKAEWSQDAAEKTGKLMMAAGITPEWNASLQGTASSLESPGEAITAIEGTIEAEKSGLHAVESYEDVSTISRSYAVPGIKRFVNSGDHKIGMQMAVHKNDKDNSNRVTIGLPLITIEY
ncbi:YwmB family TATA-box binding protein [Paenibacillus sp. FSL H8-0122]|uniref:YwmB family TATA-box binding protein n=1 Tax=Paenibacillus sp. FSL H8-0122 TaxID=2954510 RepID=UPI0030F7D6C0